MIKTQNHEMSLAWEQSGHDRGVSRAARSNTLLMVSRTCVLTHLGTVVLPYGLASSFRFLKSKMDGRLCGKTG